MYVVVARGPGVPWVMLMAVEKRLISFCMRLKNAPSRRSHQGTSSIVDRNSKVFYRLGVSIEV